MGNRIIRGEILNSERYAQVDDAARLLFLHLCLLADDCGTLSLAPTYVRRQAFVRAADHAEVERLLLALADVDLIRIYEVKGSRYGFIPRFAQRCRITRLHHPMPPEALYADDDAAVQAFDHAKSGIRKNKGLAPNLSDNGQPSADSGQQNAPTRAMNPNPNQESESEANQTPSLPATAAVPRSKSLDCEGELSGLPKSEAPPAAPPDDAQPVRTGQRTRVPEGPLPAEWRAYCEHMRPELDPDKLHAEFVAYWRDVHGAAGFKARWLGAWRNRVRDARAAPGLLRAGVALGLGSRQAAPAGFDEYGRTPAQAARHEALLRDHERRKAKRNGGVDAELIGAEIREVRHEQ